MTAACPLLYKPDWPEARQRYIAWWHGEKLDRCLLFVQAPRDKPPEVTPPPPAKSPEQYWTDLDYVAARVDHWLANQFYGAEAFPCWSPGHAGCLAIPGFYGAPLTLDFETGWYAPILTGQKLDVSGLKLDRTGHRWQFAERLLRRARQEAAGKSLPSMGAIYGVGDTLAALRGANQFLMDMADDPVAVREAELALLADWFAVFEHQTSILRNADDWYATWFHLWAPGKFYPLQCDVSYGISRDTFRECFVPALRRQADYLDYAVYHLDGVGAFHLLDEILAIERITAIQILPGAGKPGPLHYLDLLKKVQRAGKRLHITIRPDEVPHALSVLSCRGLCLDVWADSETQARQVIADAQRLSVDRG